MSNTTWQKIGAIAPDGDLYLMKIASRLWLQQYQTKIKLDKHDGDWCIRPRTHGSQPKHDYVTGNNDLMADIEDVLNNDLDFDCPDTSSDCFRKRYNKKQCITAFDGNGNEHHVTITAFKKTEEFGGGGGGQSGLGADETELAESAACWVAARCYHLGKKLPEDWTVAAVDASCMTKSVGSKVDTTAHLDNIYRFLSGQPEWTYATVMTANHLFSNRVSPAAGKSKGYYKFYRGTNIVDDITDAFKKVNDADKDGTQRRFSNLNKWTPADMYLVKASAENQIKSDLLASNTFAELNAKMLGYLIGSSSSDSFDKKARERGSLVGVSLKKFEAPNRGKIEEQNYSWRQAAVDLRTRRLSKARKKMDEYSCNSLESLDAYLKTGNLKVQFRSTDTAGRTWQGEWLGPSADVAKYGKLGGGVFDRLCKNTVGKGFFDHCGIAKTSVAADQARRQISPGISGYSQELKDLVLKHGKKIIDSVHASNEGWTAKGEGYEVPLEWFEGDEQGKIRGRGAKNVHDSGKWRFAKYLSLMVIDFVDGLTISQRDDLMSAVYLYATSQSDDSAPFIKIS